MKRMMSPKKKIPGRVAHRSLSVFRPNTCTPFYNACMTLYAKICGSDFSRILFFTPFLPFPFKS